MFSLLAFSPVVAAQAIDPCSLVSVASPSKVDAGMVVVFTASVENRLGQVTYKWTTSAGTITSGQDTSTMTGDTTGLGGQAIEATVEVTGQNVKCSAKSKTSITPPIVDNMTFDAYGDINWQDEKARLDNFAIQIINSPDARGSIMTSAGNPTYRGEAQYRLQRAKNYLVKVRRIDPARLIMIDGGYRSELTTTLRLVYNDETVPSPDPYGVLPFSQVRFTKRPPSQLKRRINPRP